MARNVGLTRYKAAIHSTDAWARYRIQGELSRQLYTEPEN